MYEETQQILLSLQTDDDCSPSVDLEAMATPPCRANSNSSLESVTVATETDSCRETHDQDAHAYAYDILESNVNSKYTVTDSDGDRVLEHCQSIHCRHGADSISHETMLDAPEDTNLADGNCCISGSIGALHGSINESNEDAIDTKAQVDGHVLHDDNFDNGKLGINEDDTDDAHGKNISARRGLKISPSSCFSNTPSVQVIYNCLTSESKEKLKNLLKQWAEWHSTFAGFGEGHEVDKHSLESGDEMYFPALQIGGRKRTAVPFWMDKPSKHARIDVAVDVMTIIQDRERDVPLYDRAGIGALISEETESYIEGSLAHSNEGSRCFNCGSYSHSLKDCPRPRDNTAVNNARKQLAEKRGSGSRAASRYYQHSTGGKFDDLKPGVLGSEVRQLLGIGELDPPPWLNRMRELGYPPGYLEDQEDEPSGITIFGLDEDDMEGKLGKDGENILGEHKKKLSRKDMIVDFPGVNTPIPCDADTLSWGSPAGSNAHHQRSGHMFSFSAATHSADAFYQRNDDPDAPPGTMPQELYHRSSGRESVSPQQSNTRSLYLGGSSLGSSRSPYDELHSLPHLGGSCFVSRQSLMNNVRPFQSPSHLIQRPPYYGQDYRNDGFDPRQRAWALAQEALQSMHHSGMQSLSKRH